MVLLIFGSCLRQFLILSAPRVLDFEAPLLAMREQHWGLSGSLQVLGDGCSAALAGDVLNT